MLIAMLGASGAQWGLLQSVAWTTMLINNLHTASLKQAVETTFDGNHPCCMCKAIAAAKKAEKKNVFVVQLKKFDFVSEPFRFVFQSPQAFFEISYSSECLPDVSHRPPVPPPRAV